MSLMYSALLPRNGNPWIQAPSIPAYDFGTGDFTLVAMVATTQGGPVLYRMANDSAEPNAGFMLLVTSTGIITFVTSDGTGGQGATTVNATNVLDGGCHTLAAIRRGTSLQLVLDGTPLECQVASDGTPPFDVTVDLPLIIGGQHVQWGEAGTFDGTLMNVGVWNRALEPDELTAVGFGRIDTADPSLCGAWTLDQTDEDSSTYGNTAMLNGSATYTPCIACEWTTGANGYAYCTMTNAPVPARPSGARLVEVRTIDVEPGTPGLAMAIMATPVLPAFPVGTIVRVIDPVGNRYDRDVNQENLFVATHDGQPWAMMVVDPQPGTWTVEIDASEQTWFSLQLQTIPSQDIVETIDGALAPLYGPGGPAEAEGWLDLFAHAAVAALAGAAVVSLVLFSGGTLAPAVVAGLAAFTSISLAESALALEQLDHHDLDAAYDDVAGGAGFLIAADPVVLIDANVPVDVATREGYRRRKEVLYPTVTMSPFNRRRTDLVGREVTRKNVQSALLSSSTGYISACGHGLPKYLTGWYVTGTDGPLQEILTVGKYDPREVRGKIIHFLACWCGSKEPSSLGRDMVANGALAFFGYKNPFILAKDFADVFFDCDIAIDKALLAGRSCQEAYDEAYAKYSEEIETLFPINRPAAVSLRKNRDSLVAPTTNEAYGNPSAHLVRGIATGPQRTATRRDDAPEALPL
ncbi:MAG: LamG domain-containing protein [Patulibacter sp.]